MTGGGRHRPARASPSSPTFRRQHRPGPKFDVPISRWSASHFPHPGDEGTGYAKNMPLPWENAWWALTCCPLPLVKRGVVACPFSLVGRPVASRSVREVPGHGIATAQKGRPEPCVNAGRSTSPTAPPLGNPWSRRSILPSVHVEVPKLRARTPPTLQTAGHRPASASSARACPTATPEEEQCFRRSRWSGLLSPSRGLPIEARHDGNRSRRRGRTIDKTVGQSRCPGIGKAWIEASRCC